jgi:Uma2 family endonuclease
MATADATELRTRDCLVLDPVSWQDYTSFLKLFADRPAWRLTFDRGVLEIMSPSGTHESSVDLLGRFVDILTDELDLPVKAGASTTYRRKKAQRGLEPDRSWWIANEGLVRSKREIDLSQDPPPDLCIEVDVTHSSLDRMRIYATLGVPEVWQLNDESLTFHVLKKKSYEVKSASLAFPFVTPEVLLTHLGLLGQLDNTAIVREFRAWVRLQIADVEKT